MKLKQFFTDDDAVSPVIGVILMVAITVILAAVIASFVLGLGDSTNTTPQASFDWDYDQSNDALTITHESGDTIDGDKMAIVTSGVVDGSGSATDYDINPFSGDDVSAGDTYTLDGTDDSQWTAASGDMPVDMDEATIRITFTPSSGDSYSTLATWEGPDA
jgi:flagellin-like protein